ncbi:MAG: acyl-CoA dehydrogenase [Streptosporangiaceae bacterium]
MPIAVTGEQQALASSLRDWAKRAQTIATVRAMESGPAREKYAAIWHDLDNLGVFGIGVEQGTLTDLAVAVEELAHALTPGPVLPTALASHLLGRSVQTGAFATSPGTLAATRHPDGRITISGRTSPVLGTPGELIVTTGHDWFHVTGPAVVTPLTPLDFSRELTAIELADATAELIRKPQVGALFAAEAAGVARWCLETAVDYAKTRSQFGHRIGEFQAVKHLCATMACRAERAAALAWDASRGGDSSAAQALEDAVENAKDCVQVLGGIGFTWEHDAHLYLRRAVALRQLLDIEPRNEPYRYNDDGPPSIGMWAIPAINQFGTEDQKARFNSTDITWCQLFSEPEAGSDLASLRTKATKTGSGWTLSGQKVWTSLAREADYAICLARTDPDVPKHKGLSYFLVDMRAPGITIRPLREMTGRSVFNEVFLDDVFVPANNLLGQPGDGWRIAMSTLATERERMGAGQVEALLAERGTHPAIRKLVGVESRQRQAEQELRTLGRNGAIDSPEATEFLLTRCLSIAGGTTQILLNQVAERVLGLPR